MRVPLNCIIVAAWLWATSRFKSYVFFRRSLHFRGLIPHAGVAYGRGFRDVIVVEYVPPKQDLWTRRNIGVLFEGRYRVWEFRGVRRRSFKSMDDLNEWLADARKEKVVR